MADGVALHLPGHTIRLKWHRLRRVLGDPVFTAKRLEEGLALGASLEVDLRLHAGGGFVVLHEEALEPETTGSGLVADASPADLRRLRIRDNDGRPTGNPVLLLADVAALVRRHRPTQALLQLDLKETISRLTIEIAAGFAATLAGLTGNLTLSGGDWAAVKRLADGVRGIGTGYDPCDLPEARRLVSPGDAAAFVELTERIAPEADTIYLDYGLILAAHWLGYDMVEAFHRRGRRIDAWTLNSDHPNVAATLRTLVDLRVDQITTDEPAKLEALWAGMQPRLGS
jgi:glycerophosphoryl diester phosphodiesterase